jgi:hypothetical protein
MRYPARYRLYARLRSALLRWLRRIDAAILGRRTPPYA